ncbi:MAG: 3-deoxy-D-manno-octulosonic acid transferase [Alphaproteobacteria bacterium]|nr:3-deoxy-D-manno-octulosonic acid transferase [Alphaproteobacteria bacterium]
MSLILHGLTSAAGPFIPLWLRLRARRGKEDPARLSERYGHGAERPVGQLIWLHGASVGESQALIPLIEALAERLPDAQFLVTTGTVTSAKLLESRMPAALAGRWRHRYATIDRLAWVARFLAGWKPDAAVFIESELWPNTILAARHVRVKLALVNARMSARSAERWERLAPGLARRILRSFDLVQPQTPGDEVRLRALGARDMLHSGDLKLSSPPLPHDAAELAALRDGGPVFVAASTHPGEEAVIAAAHHLLLAQFPTLRTVIVPRHPDRGADIAAETGAPRRSQGAPIQGLVVADTLGELGLFYRLADVALVGGSLVPHGGQNPMEPARLGCPILLGPHTGNFADRVAELLEEGAARRVDPPDAATLARAVADVLVHSDDGANMAEAGRRVASHSAGTAELLAERIAQWLRPAELPALQQEQEPISP